MNGNVRSQTYRDARGDQEVCLEGRRGPALGSPKFLLYPARHCFCFSLLLTRWLARGGQYLTQEIESNICPSKELLARSTHVLISFHFLNDKNDTERNLKVEKRQKHDLYTWVDLPLTDFISGYILHGLSSTDKHFSVTVTVLVSVEDFTCG